MTAPSDEALVYDIEQMKGLGFNMLRKHIKVESDRWYYHCDRWGRLVWQDMVSGGDQYKPWHTSYKPTFFRGSWGRYADDTAAHQRNLAAGSDVFREEWTRSCAATISCLQNHPSVITWVLFNEGWGQFDARAATALARRLDPTRPIDAVSGWYDQNCGDFISVHNYFRPLEVYSQDNSRDGGQKKRAFVISEFGGLSFLVPNHAALDVAYGYGSFAQLDELHTAVGKTLEQANALEQAGLAGYVYTQLSDVEEEMNGILSYDRRVNKLDPNAQVEQR
jgi:hypothetical protein